MLTRLDEVVARWQTLRDEQASPEVFSDPKKLRDVSRRLAELDPLVEAYKAYRKLQEEEAGARQVLEGETDPEMRAMAEDEVRQLTEALAAREEQLKLLLLPVDPNDRRNVVLEVRAGTGGEEAALFASEVLRMYTRYAEVHGWKVTITDISEAGMGGVKEAVALVEGDGAYARLKYESGVHRVQRVPATEASGRIHTSAITVAVLAEAEEVEIDVQEKDLRIDRFCSSGAGGQSVNTTYSAIRITHLPYRHRGAVPGRAQPAAEPPQGHARPQGAALRGRPAGAAGALAAERRSMVGSGDRSEKIRTYNFPQSRVTDHRIGLTVHRLQEIMDGALDMVVDPLITHHQAERLQRELAAAS